MPNEHRTVDEVILLSTTKKEIADTIRQKLREDGHTYRSFTAETTFNYAQLARVAAGHNYTIDTLILVLHEAGLKLTIEKKED
jgi:uncharacterized protein YerC